jgi:hypothetical protein
MLSVCFCIPAAVNQKEQNIIYLSDGHVFTFILTLRGENELEIAIDTQHGKSTKIRKRISGY